MQRPGRDFRSYSLTPGWPIEVEVQCANGGVAVVIDRVPWLAGEHAQRIVITNAVATPLPAHRAAA